MRLSNIDLARLLPVFMQEDKIAKIFVSLLNTELRKVSKSVDSIRFFTSVDSMKETVLDELAWQFNVTEYQKTFDIKTKRKLIKDCLSIHHKRGTVSAVKEVVEKIYGTAIVEEWFNYEGNPYCFRVKTTNASSSDAMIEELTNVIKTTQNVRSYLESVIIELDNMMNLYTGTVMATLDDESFLVDTSDIDFNIDSDFEMSLYTGFEFITIDDESFLVDTSDIDGEGEPTNKAICGSSTAICGEVYCGN